MEDRRGRNAASLGGHFTRHVQEQPPRTQRLADFLQDFLFATQQHCLPRLVGWCEFSKRDSRSQRLKYCLLRSRMPSNRQNHVQSPKAFVFRPLSSVLKGGRTKDGRQKTKVGGLWTLGLWTGRAVAPRPPTTGKMPVVSVAGETPATPITDGPHQRMRMAKPGVFACTAAGKRSAYAFASTGDHTFVLKRISCTAKPLSLEPISLNGGFKLEPRAFPL